MADIVEWLRGQSEYCNDGIEDVCSRAADEIERLRAALASINADVRALHRQTRSVTHEILDADTKAARDALINQK